MSILNSKKISGTVTRALNENGCSIYYVQLENGYLLSVREDLFKPPLKSDLEIGTTVEIIHRSYKIIRAQKQLSTDEKAHLDKTLSQITKALHADDCKQAEHFYKNIEGLLDYGDFEKMLMPCRIRQAIRKFDFAYADELQNGFWMPVEEFQRIKIAALITYFNRRPEMAVNDEQVEAIAANYQNVLVKARAGSGKTRVLACKTALLIDRYAINPDHILILAFNKKAATEIGNRIQREFGFESYENARTFHSLAYQLVQPREKILFDEKGEFARHKLSNFIQGILRQIWNPAFQKKLYELFRKEMASIEYSGALLDDADYYSYIRSLRDITLGGDRVKSQGEKYIADFLFEYDISYAYERVEFWSGHNYRPDFFIHNLGKDYVIEFWGIDENDPQKEIPRWWDTTWDQYYHQMEEKRAYWRDKGVPLVELSVVDLPVGRQSFERILKSYLEDAGIICQRLPQKEIEAKVIRNQKDRMSELFAQFIQKAKKAMLTAEDMQNKVSEYIATDERAKIFLELACRVYREYEMKLAKENLTDFDQLLLQVAQLVRETGGECSIPLGRKKDRLVKMKDLKWILIDEYQDFSKLFFNMLDAIRLHNPRVRLMCVGDDWQAINSFAGSNLGFFYEFETLLPQSGTSHMQTNYRSQKRIVETGNKLMEGLGKPGIPLQKNSGGEVTVEAIDDIWVETRSGESYAEARQDDQRFIFYEKRAKMIR